MAENAAPTRRPKPVVLCILDGWGLRAETADNAVALAETPAYDRMCATLPMSRLSASGVDVGLPAGQMGNSEVGHMTIGAGRVIDMDLRRIDRAIEDGRFDDLPPLRRFIARVSAAGGAVHLGGLASPGGVHSHQRHLIAAARALDAAGLAVRLHLFLDGRDTPPRSADRAVAEIEAALADRPGVTVATVSGRFFAMDRDDRWERVERAWRAIALGEAEPAASAAEAVRQAYARGESDEFAAPASIAGYSGVEDGDGLFLINFRADRALEILAALLDPAFDGFARDRTPVFSAALGMTHYSDALAERIEALFPPERIDDAIGPWIARCGLRQLRLAETEKYPHVTYFFNGGDESVSPGESRHMAPSPKVATYDLAPEMAAAEVTETLTNAIHSADYELIVVNYANPDMVGHSGDLQAAIRAVEAVDAGLGAVWAAIEAVGGAMIVTADHGNCELMRDPITGGPHTAHTTNPVPILLAGGAPGARLAEGGSLSDLAPTLLDLLGLDQPAKMTGRSLLIRPGRES